MQNLASSPNSHEARNHLSVECREMNMVNEDHAASIYLAMIRAQKTCIRVILVPFADRKNEISYSKEIYQHREMEFVMRRCLKVCLRLATNFGVHLASE